MKKLNKTQAEAKLRKQINKAAETYLCNQTEGDLYDAYQKLLKASDNGNDDALADNYVTVWEPLASNTTVAKMIELIENGIEEPEIPEFVKEIDWTLLKQQKKTLIEVLDFFDRVTFNAKTDENPRVINDLNGILNLIDSIQDAAVDEYGLDEHLVFDLHEEEDKFKPE